VAANLGLEVLGVAEIDQRVQPVGALSPDIAPAPAIAWLADRWSARWGRGVNAVAANQP
jgi:hypothetical protein